MGKIQGIQLSIPLIADKRPKRMRVLLACEESQAVCKAFRAKGHEAFSCDVLPCSGGHPEWHIQGDVLEYLNGFYKCKCGTVHEESLGKYGCCGVSKWYEWDMMIAFPPCTHLATSGAKHFAEKQADGRQHDAILFFFSLVDAPIPRIAIENPVGIMSRHYRKPDQIIQPYQFGDPFQKTTCIWLKNLPPLNPVKIVHPGEFYISPKGARMPKWYSDLGGGKKGGNRSKTFPGIAQAMADQWG